MGQRLTPWTMTTLTFSMWVIATVAVMPAALAVAEKRGISGSRFS